MKIERIQYPSSNSLAPGAAAKVRSGRGQTQTAEAVDFDGKKRDDKQKQKESDTKDQPSAHPGEGELIPGSATDKTIGVDVIA